MNVELSGLYEGYEFKITAASAAEAREELACLTGATSAPVARPNLVDGYVLTDQDLLTLTVEDLRAAGVARLRDKDHDAWELTGPRANGPLAFVLPAIYRPFRLEVAQLPFARGARISEPLSSLELWSQGVRVLEDKDGDRWDVRQHEIRPWGGRSRETLDTRFAPYLVIEVDG